MMIDSKLLPAIQLLWEFNQINQELEKSDFILVLGSSDLLVPKHAANIYNQGFATKIVASGGFGRLTGDFKKPEAEVFSDILIQNGVSPQNIIIENKSTNTGENLKFSYEIVVKNNLQLDKVILVTKSYMEKRALATFKKQWPNPKSKVIITSPKKTFEDFMAMPDYKDSINIMVGDVQRLKIYPDLGYMIYTEIPDNIWQAYELLVENGFNKSLIKS